MKQTLSLLLTCALLLGLSPAFAVAPAQIELVVFAAAS